MSKPGHKKTKTTFGVVKPKTKPKLPRGWVKTQHRGAKPKHVGEPKPKPKTAGKGKPVLVFPD